MSASVLQVGDSAVEQGPRKSAERYSLRQTEQQQFFFSDPNGGFAKIEKRLRRKATIHQHCVLGGECTRLTTRKSTVTGFYIAQHTLGTGAWSLLLRRAALLGRF